MVRTPTSTSFIAPQDRVEQEPEDRDRGGESAPIPPSLDELAALSDGRLNSARRHELLRHLASCREDRELLADLVRALPKPRPHPAL